MKQLFFSVKLLVFGSFCDTCASICTHLAEKNLAKNKPLNKKLLIFMSNFSNNIFSRWIGFERRFLKEFSNNSSMRIP